MLLGVEDLDLGVGLYVAGSDLALAVHLNIHCLGLVAVETRDDVLNIQNYLGHVLLDAGDDGKFVLHTGYLDGSDRGSGER